MSNKPKYQWNAKNVNRYGLQKNKKFTGSSKENKGTLLGIKTKRNIEDTRTNDSSIQNRPISEAETYIENEKKNMLSFESSSIKYGKNSKDIFKERANKEKTKIKKGKGLSRFDPRLRFKSEKNDKLNIYKKSQNNEESEESEEDSQSKDNQIDLNEDEEESDIKENNNQQYHIKKKRHIKVSQDSDNETNEIKGNNSSDDEENFENKNISNRHGNANYPLVRKNDNPNVVSRDEFNALKANFEALSKQMVKLVKLAGVQGEINYQNEKYIKNNLCVKIDNLDYKYKVLINSYRVLFIRKLSNIFLDEIYERYGKFFQTFEFKYNKKRHKISACICEIEGVGRDNINLIVDFLKHIKIRASDIIHMQDKEIKFRKEILFDYLNRELENNTISKDNFLTLKDAISLVFRSEKEKVTNKKEINHLENMKKIFEKEKEKEDNNHPEKAKLTKERKIKNKYKTDNYEEKDEEEEERIRKILSGDENLLETNLSSQLDLLLQKIELNREIVNPVKKIDELKKITSQFFFDSWKNSFINEGFKSHKTYKYFVNPDNITSVKNMGRYLRELLKGITINLENTDPNKLDIKVEKE